MQSNIDSGQGLDRLFIMRQKNSFELLRGKFFRREALPLQARRFFKIIAIIITENPPNRRR